MRTLLLVVAVMVGCSGSSKKHDGDIVVPVVKQDPAPVEPEPAPAITAVAEPTTPFSNDDLESTLKSRSRQEMTAWQSNEDGIAAMKQGKFGDATTKFRDAVARVPDPSYFLNICMSLYQEGKFSEALVACDAVANNNPKPATKGKAEQMGARIKVAAKKQNITVQ